MVVMWRVQLASVIVLAVLNSIESSGPPAGKCNAENLVVVPLPVKEMEKHLYWKVLYVTEFGPHIDHESYIFSIIGEQNYKLKNKIVLGDNTESKYRAIMKYIDNVLVEDAVDANGTRHYYYMYPLALTRSYGVLIYRCSDAGRDQVDYRLIAFPEESIPSDSEIQELLDLDKETFKNARGNLIRLPNEIID